MRGKKKLFSIPHLQNKHITHWKANVSLVRLRYTHTLFALFPLYLNFLVKSSFHDKSLVEIFESSTHLVRLDESPEHKNFCFHAIPSKRNRSRLDGYFMFEILASKQWRQHSVGGRDTAAVLKQRAYISKKVHKRQDLPGKNYSQQKWRWGKGYACMLCPGKARVRRVMMKLKTKQNHI